MSKVFVSQSNLDTEESARLLSWLQAQGFVAVFLDFDKHAGIPSGLHWERTLYRELTDSYAVLLLLTSHWFDSKWCFVEFAQARYLGKAIIPLIVTQDGQSLVSADIQHLNLVRDREGGLERLRNELKRTASDSRNSFVWDTTRPLLPGLLSFDEADAAIYFGRDADVRRLIEQLNVQRSRGGSKLIAVLGASGAGKSSLMLAGVIPRLRRDAHNWIVLSPFRPQTSPLNELATTLAASSGGEVTPQFLRESLDREDPSSVLRDVARDIRAQAGQVGAQILLVIDQAEELFGRADAHETAHFCTILKHMLDEQLPYVIVMTLRSDYLGQLQELPQLGSLIHSFSLKPMPLDRVRDIIVGPAGLAGIDVEDAFISEVIADAHTDDALPLLAFALRELYERSGSSSRFTVEAYRALGDPSAQLSPLENAVRRKADEVLATTAPATEDMSALKDAFIPGMVRVSAEGEYVKRAAVLSSLPPRALPLLERLTAARLTIIRQEQGVALIEVAHEAMLRKWPRLRGWLDDERDFLIARDRLEADLLYWERAGKKNQALLAGVGLTRAKAWLRTRPNQLNDRERIFIQKSSRYAMLRYAKRFLIAVAIVSTPAILLWLKSVPLLILNIFFLSLGYTYNDEYQIYSGIPVRASLWRVCVIALILMFAAIALRLQRRWQLLKGRTITAAIILVSAFLMYQAYQVARTHGAPWTPRASGVTQKLNAISGDADGQHLWIVGEAGMLLTSEDRGAHWTAQTSPTQLPLTTILATADGRRKWVGGQGVLAESDSNGQWIDRTLSTRFLDPQSNAIAHWENFVPGDLQGLQSIIASGDAKHLWAIDDMLFDSSLLESEDGGVHWSEFAFKSLDGTDLMNQRPGRAACACIVSIFRPSEGAFVWGVGAEGMLAFSQDNGAHWMQIGVVTDENLYSIAGSANGTHLYAVGAYGTILESHDSGAHWTPRNTESDALLRRAGNDLLSVTTTADGRQAWAVGRYGTILESHDAGVHWQARTSNTADDLISVFATSNGNPLWAVGNNGTILEWSNP